MVGEGTLFFFLVFCACSQELTDVFKKNEKKNKTMSVYRLEIMEPLWYAPCHLFVGFPHAWQYPCALSLKNAQAPVANQGGGGKRNSYLYTGSFGCNVLPHPPPPQGCLLGNLCGGWMISLPYFRYELLFLERQKHIQSTLS